MKSKNQPSPAKPAEMQGSRQTAAKLAAINTSLAALLEEVHRALAGERTFSVELVRELASLVSEMDPVLPRSKELRKKHPELSAPLDQYILLATELRSDLEKVRMMLASQRVSLESSRSHLHSVSQWVSALSSTR